jgi:hypothetical protein
MSDRAVHLHNKPFMLRVAVVILAASICTACASFNDPDDDPALCENGRRPKSDGECPNPSAPMSGHNLAQLKSPPAAR